MKLTGKIMIAATSLALTVPAYGSLKETIQKGIKGLTNLTKTSAEPTAKELKDLELREAQKSDVLLNIGAMIDDLEKCKQFSADSPTSNSCMREKLGEFEIDGEQMALDRGVEAVIKTILNRAHDLNPHRIAKGDHGKAHACLNGTMTFSDGIDEALQKGVVKSGAVYDVTSRISNAEHTSRSDRSGIGQGFALKLWDVSNVLGKSPNRLPDYPAADQQDFLMTMPSVFFVPNIVVYSRAFALRGGDKSVGNLTKVATSRHILARGAAEVLATARGKSFHVTKGMPINIMAQQFWSKHPYAWGERGDEQAQAIKYSIKPCDGKDDNYKVPAKDAPTDKMNFQKAFVKKAFKDNNGRLCYQFMVQPRPTGSSSDELEKQYPIEDGSIDWKVEGAPFVRVATVTFLEKDNSDWQTAESLKKCNTQTEFNPWNGLMAHQPLGNLARGRRVVYRASALVRQEKDNLNLKFPQDDKAEKKK